MCVALKKSEEMKKLYNKVDKEVLKENMMATAEPRTTLSFYKYAKIGNPRFFRDHIFINWNALNVFGRVYVAHEGINAQISVPEAQFDTFKSVLNEITFLQNIRLNLAIEDDGKSFYVLKIKVRDKIVADGLDDKAFDVTNAGQHISAQKFNELSYQKGTVIVDMRNHYESEIGHFEGAWLPDVETFRESLPIIEDELKKKNPQNIVMYCTGGIRCEKASAYFKHKGFENVHQLEGGIIEYRRQIEQLGLENKFKGKNFVFDERMGERIGDEIIAQCHQCGVACDNHVNCANDACHILFIQCDHCAEKMASCCSTKCADFVLLPDEVRKEKTENGNLQWNGIRKREV